MEHENETVQAKALRLLEAIYERTVITRNPVHATKLAVTIGSTEEEALAAWQYLKERDLIKTYNIAGAARVNANGIDAIEDAKKSILTSRHADLVRSLTIIRSTFITCRAEQYSRLAHTQLNIKR